MKWKIVRKEERRERGKMNEVSRGEDLSTKSRVFFEKTKIASYLLFTISIFKLPVFKSK